MVNLNVKIPEGQSGVEKLRLRIGVKLNYIELKYKTMMEYKSNKRKLKLEWNWCEMM